jgi:predicted acylesterase/phospholipase RssA
MGSLRHPPTPLGAGYNPAELVNLGGEVDAEHQIDMKDLFAIAERIRRERAPTQPVPIKNVLVVSGGGSYGAYCAGVLAGWTKTGQRPSFDVVTGISTGALLAPLAFLGPDYDCELRELYTTLRTRDVFRLKKTLRSLLSESLADTTPLARKVEEYLTPDLLRAIAAEHGKGRRLYIGTTELESRRAVIWDIGEIATRGTMEDLLLCRKILLASSAIPGFFPPVRIPVTVNGQLLEERHIDGGVTNSLFFRLPHVPPEKMKDPEATCLHGSNVHILVAGKLFADATPVSSRALSIAGNSISTLIYAQTRSDLLKLYTACILTGMNYRLSAIPPDFDAPTSSTDFNPATTSRLFAEGERQVLEGTAWRTTPPGLEHGEGSMYRVGTDLVPVRRGETLPIPSTAGQRIFPLGTMMEMIRKPFQPSTSK